MSQAVKRQRQKQQRQLWRRRIEQEKNVQRYMQNCPQREQPGYKPCEI